MKKHIVYFSLGLVFALGSLLCGCINEAEQPKGEAAVKAANPDQSQMKEMYQKNKRGSRSGYPGAAGYPGSR